MSTAAGGLEELHSLLRQLADVEEQLARGPRQIAAARKRAEKKAARIDELSESLKQLRMAADGKGLQLKTNEAKIGELKGKLNAAGSNREFQIIKSQIDADEMANSVLEDEILETLDKADGVQSDIGATKKAHAQALTDVETTSKDVAAKEPGLKTQAAELRDKIGTAETALPESVRLTYRRLVAAHGASALARVDERACGECHALVSSNELIELNVGKTIFCRSCGRILYRVQK